MKKTYLLILAACLLWGPGSRAAAEPLKTIGTATAVSVTDGDTLILDRTVEGSNEVRLVGIQAPKLPLGRKGFKAWPLAGAAKAELEKLVLGKRLTLSFGGAPMDRHGRLLAHLHDEDGRWVQGELLRLGLARVYSFPDNRARVADMLKLEAEARAQRRGIWALRFYEVRTAETVAGGFNTFQLVEGRVRDTAKVKGTVYLNFGADWRSDFTISVSSRAARMFTKAGIDLLQLKGRIVRVRGWLKKRNGPMIEATHPEQIEITDG
ncbi:MAG: thermonuclease family protein [Rhodospirillales bacterium]|nr:thermonuclease family protein [Rhodospirillales bacterium]